MQWQQLLRRQAAARLLPASWAVLVQVTGEVLALLQERQDRRKAKLLAHRRDVHFTVREEVLLHTEHTPLPSQLLLSQAGMGPLKVLAFTASTPTACTSFPQWPSRPSLWRGRRAGARGGRAAQMRYDRPHVLVQWTGSDASGDTLEPLESMTNCKEAIAAFERATGCTLPQPAQRLPLSPPNHNQLPQAGLQWHSRRCTPVDSWRGACGPAAALLVAGRRLAALHRRPPLSASRVLARGSGRWPTPSRLGRRRCAARLTRCLTLLPMVPGGCCCPDWLGTAWA
jgi:hypothetical protein